MTDSYLEGKRLAKKGDFQGALPHLRRAVEEKPKSPDAWLALGACYFRLDRNDDFREALRRALAIDPEHAPTLRFLKKTTGAEVIPAPDTGREKIYMEEEICPGGGVQKSGNSSSGCFGVLLGIVGILFVRVFLGRLLELADSFRLYY